MQVEPEPGYIGEPTHYTGRTRKQRKTFSLCRKNRDIEENLLTIQVEPEPGYREEPGYKL